MDLEFKDRFIELWTRYFAGAELPLIFFYTDSPSPGGPGPELSSTRCLVASLSKARRGETLCLDAETIGCPGGKRYAGFTRGLRPGFEFFLSCGIPGEMEGERYKKTPELVKEILAKAPDFRAPARYIVFKRWDRLEPSDEPAVAVFFAQADVLSGLFTLASFDLAVSEGVIAPFSAGCGSIVEYPYLEKKASPGRCVLGLFDPSARPCVQTNVVSFAAPMAKFTRMITVEENTLMGGFGSAVLELFAERGLTGCVVRRMGIPDEFAQHATQKELRHLYGIDAEGIVSAAREMLTGVRF